MEESNSILLDSIKRFLEFNLKKQLFDDELELVKSEKKIVYDAWLTGILLSFKNLKMTLKVHYNHPNVIKIREGIEIDEQSPELYPGVDDFFKEVCNLCVGRLKSTVEDKVPCGISLPFITTGFDEFFFYKNLTKKTFVQTFTIEGKNKNLFTISIDYQFHNDNVEETLREIAQNLDLYVEENSKEVESSDEEDDELVFL